jgi:HD-GYP domain-containing protein (c-di-GMP phosphodiesterase class II)
MGVRERTVVGASALGLLLTTAALSFVLPSDPAAEAWIVVALVGLFAWASRVEFEVGSNTAVPAQLVFVPMLFLAPLSLVPLLVAAGFLLGELPDYVRGRIHPDRWLYAITNAWFAIGPVVVIGLLAPAHPTMDAIWVYALAIVAQFISSAFVWCILGYALRGDSPLATLRVVVWDERINAFLSPIAFMVGAIGHEHPPTVLAVAPLLWLLQIFSRERSERYAAALELHQTYRGTVMVLSDVVEADDNYTADHCRSVVDLAIATADELDLAPSERQELETAALLHDVGKIAIPKEILNKPSRLTTEEFELMKSHTLEGQALLDRVGGRLARVGQIVRSCHERWDGQGYPDGLRGEEIPLAARIVFCCDAFSAMTTDRPYRAAMPTHKAVAELRANAGTQFEPRVVDAVCRVVTRTARPPQPYADAVRAVLAGNAPLPAAGVKAV